MVVVVLVLVPPELALLPLAGLPVGGADDPEGDEPDDPEEGDPDDPEEGDPDDPEEGDPDDPEGGDPAGGGEPGGGGAAWVFAVGELPLSPEAGVVFTTCVV